MMRSSKDKPHTLSRFDCSSLPFVQAGLLQTEPTCNNETLELAFFSYLRFAHSYLTFSAFYPPSLQHPEVCEPLGRCAASADSSLLNSFPSAILLTNPPSPASKCNCLAGSCITAGIFLIIIHCLPPNCKSAIFLCRLSSAARVRSN